MTDPTAEPITVVSGLPRSGTSLMMQMLAAGGMPLLHDAHRPPDASNPHGYFEYEPVKRLKKDASWLHEARGKAVKIIAYLLPSLPGHYDYRVIFMRRPLPEVLASQRRMIEPSEGATPPLGDDEMARLFEKHIHHIASHLPTQANTKVLDIAFHETIADPAGTARAVNAFVGGHLDERAMAGVVDQTLYRERGSENVD